MSVSSITLPRNQGRYPKENALDLTPHIVYAFMTVFENNLPSIQNFAIERRLGEYIDKLFYSYQFSIFIDDCECLVLTVGKNNTLIMNEFKTGTDEYDNPCCTLPTKELLDAVVLVALFSNMKYISIVDDSSIFIGKKSRCSYSLALLYLLETGNSWWDTQGFSSKKYSEEYEYNRRLLDRPLDFFNPQQHAYLKQIIDILIFSYKESFDSIGQITLHDFILKHIVPHKHTITKCADPMYKIIHMLQLAFMFDDNITEATKKKVLYYEYEERLKDLRRTLMPQVLENYMNKHSLTLEEIQNEIGSIQQYLLSHNKNITELDVYAESDSEQSFQGEWIGDTIIHILPIMSFLEEYRLTHAVDNGTAMMLDDLESNELDNFDALVDDVEPMSGVHAGNRIKKTSRSTVHKKIKHKQKMKTKKLYKKMPRGSKNKTIHKTHLKK
jgi:hypothetical protein